ncbi:hypothetical protein Tco_0835831 [Tanacetum coccineum]
MCTSIKNQSSWKMAQLKKLTFEELKLEQESSKKQKIVGIKDVLVTEEKVEYETEEDVEAFVKGNSSSGTDIPVSVVPVAIKPHSIANWKIIKLGKKGVYQIIRENGIDKIYIIFRPMLKDISRDNLIELYKLVMQKYGTNRLEEEYERVFWGDLKTMFDPPLSTDPFWNLPHQQKMLSWRYYDTCRVHCLTLESADIYMLTERKYPIPTDACQAKLDKKLQGGKEDKACYQLYLEAVMEMRRLFKCWFNHHTTNGHQFTMSNRHQELASPNYGAEEMRIMDTTQAQQKALDDALVAPDNRLNIRNCNLRLSSTLKSKEPTFQVVLDALKLTPFFKAVEITVNVPEIYMQEFWATN